MANVIMGSPIGEASLVFTVRPSATEENLLFMNTDPEIPQTLGQNWPRGEW